MHLRVQPYCFPAHHCSLLHQIVAYSNCSPLRCLCAFDRFPNQGNSQVRLESFSLGNSLGQKEKGVLTVFIVGVQIVLVLMYKFYFFDLFWNDGICGLFNKKCKQSSGFFLCGFDFWLLKNGGVTLDVLYSFWFGSITYWNFVVIVSLVIWTVFLLFFIFCTNVYYFLVLWPHLFKIIP